MRKLILIFALALLPKISHAQALFQIQKAGGSGGPAVASQTCMANAAATSVSCATSTNFTSGLTVYVLADSGNNLLSTLPTSSGAGCPSSFTNIVNGSDTNGGNYSWSKGTTQSGACTITQAETGGAANLIMFWFAVSGGTATADGSGGVATVNVGAGTTTGASYTTTHNGDLVLGAVVEIAGSTDSSFAAIAPFGTGAPGQISTGLSPLTYPQMAAYFSQGSAATTTITWTQGISSRSLSFILGVY